jgi:flavin reductase (DIM6/NTAB) family NADH-FMN oxidoreductase RutF
MNHYTIADIKSWERFYRGNFINSLSGFKSVSLIGSCNEEGQPNLAIFSNIVHLGADPALIGFINRPLEAAPHTITNIKANGQYTINHIQQSFVKQAHQTSAKYLSTQNEFEEANLTAVFKNGCIAPFVVESNIQYALELVEIVPIKHNNTFLVIGSIKDVFLPAAIVEPDGFVAIDKAGSMASLGIDSYYECTAFVRYEYARVGIEANEI